MYLCALKLIGMTGQKTPTALGTEKIGKLLMQYAIPAIIAMTASSLYNMVDSIFIGHGVGAMAISGLALTFPLMNLRCRFRLAGRCGSGYIGFGETGTKRLRHRTTGTRQCAGTEYYHRTCLYGCHTDILDPILYFFGGSDATVAMPVIIWSLSYWVTSSPTFI